MNLSKPASSEEKKGGEKVLNIYNAQTTTNFTSEQNKFVHLRACFNGNHRHHTFCWKVIATGEKKMLWDQNTRWNLQHYCCHQKTRIHAETSNTTVVTQRPGCMFKPPFWSAHFPKVRACVRACTHALYHRAVIQLLKMPRFGAASRPFNVLHIWCKEGSPALIPPSPCNSGLKANDCRTISGNPSFLGHLHRPLSLSLLCLRRASTGTPVLGGLLARNLLSKRPSTWS